MVLKILANMCPTSLFILLHCFAAYMKHLGTMHMHSGYLCSKLLPVCYLFYLFHFAWGIAEVKCILTTAVCLSVCLSHAAFPHYCTHLDVTWECPLVVHYLADLQLVHRFHCYDSIRVCKLIALYTANAYSAKCEMSASACTRSMAGCNVDREQCMMLMWW